MVVLLLAACARKNIENKDAVRQAVVEYLSARQAQTGLDMSTMDVNVLAMTFERDTARATVEFRVKNSDAGMQLNYTLDRKGDKWVVQARPGHRPGARRRAAPGDAGNSVRPASPRASFRPCTSTRESQAMKTVAVLGGGPAGASAAERLARAGLNTMVFDEKLAWEKPCGGGLTYKAYEQYPYLIDNDTPKKLIHETVVNAQGAGEAKMNLTQPLLIYSRFDLNRMLLERAERAGAAMEQTRVLGIEQKEKGWRLRTRNGTAEADFLVVATGARNPLREVGTQWARRRHDERPGLFCSGCARAYRHSVHAQVRRLHLGVPALRSSFGGHRRQRGTGAGDARAAGSLHGPARYFAQGWRPSIATCCLRSRSPVGAGIACRAEAGWPWAMPAAWWIPSPARVCITRSVRATWPARWF